MDKILFYKSTCNFNGISYQEVKFIEIDPEDNSKCICEFSKFGTKKSVPSERLFYLEDTKAIFKSSPVDLSQYKSPGISVEEHD